jgi:hypothetical protein
MIMKSKPAFIVVLVLGTFLSLAPVGAQGLFRVTFRASGKGLNQFSQETDTKITDRDIVAAAVAANGLASRTARNYLLVYNGTNDSLQVVNNGTGALLSDVIQFDGGAATTDQHQASRFTFMFLPNATTAFGSAFITEAWPGILIGDDNDRARLTARLEFALTDSQVLGGSNSTTVAITNSTGTNTLPSTNSLSSNNNSNGLAITDFGNTNGGGLGTSLNPITETNSLSLTSPATPPATTTTNAFGTVTTAAAAANATGTGSMSAVAVGSSPNMFISTAGLGNTNAANVRVYTGTFTAGRRFLPNGANSPTVETPFPTTSSVATNTAIQ